MVIIILPVVNKKFECSFTTHIKKQPANILTHNSENILLRTFYLPYVNKLYMYFNIGHSGK